MNWLLHRALPVGLALVSIVRALSAQPLPAGRWDGAIRIMSQELGIRVHFVHQGDSLAATIDIPQQNAFGLPLSKVQCVSPTISFDLPAGPGLATFRGIMAADSMSGRFEQSGMVGTFYLRQVGTESSTSPKAVETLPYEAREVTFTNDTVSLAGTLTMPSDGGPFPALVMITGSGPQNRDEEIFGFKPFAILADHLTRSGIAVLRFDDRGVGKSGGHFAGATTSDFAADAEAGMDFLRQQPGIRKEAVGLLGHSEGGIAAAMVAARHRDLSFLILLAAPAIRGDSIIDYQVVSAARRGGASETDLPRILSLQHQVYETVRRGTGFDTLETLLVEEGRRSMEGLTEEQRKMISSPDSLIRASVSLQMRSLRSPWFAYYITYDPMTALKRVTCPVLAIFGEVDQQVPPSMNQQPMKRALAGNPDVVLRVLPRANHLFLTSATGDPAEYATLKKEFVNGFLEEITTWLQKRFTP